MLPSVTDTSPDRPGARIETGDLGDLVGMDGFAGLLRDTLDRHLVVLLKADVIEPEAMGGLAALLGAPRTPRGAAVPGQKMALFRTGARADATAQEAEDIAHILHVDYSDLEAPPAYSLQHQRSPNAAPLPALWVDMRRVLAALPASLRRQIEPLRARHSPFQDQVNVGVHRTVRDMPADIRAKGTLHPLVCRDTHTGAPYLFLPVRRDSEIDGMPADDSRALLTALWDAVDAAPYRFSAPVRTGEIAIWDNMAAVHTRAPFPLTMPREVWFATIEGSRPAPAFSAALAAE